MNRCKPFLLKPSFRRRLLTGMLALPLLGLPGLATAQIDVRPFPPNAERGAMVVVAPPVLQMNGKPDRLSPGARIRGLNNMLLMSGSIIGQSLLVNFVRNSSGEVHDVWVLTPAEAALTLPALQ